jgi:hypothetical protein
VEVLVFIRVNINNHCFSTGDALYSFTSPQQKEYKMARKAKMIQCDEQTRGKLESMAKSHSAEARLACRRPRRP